MIVGGVRTLELLGELFSLLERRKLPAAIIGAAGLAVHGYARATADVDILARIEALCARFGLHDEWRALLPEITSRRTGRRWRLRRRRQW